MSIAKIINEKTCPYLIRHFCETPYRHVLYGKIKNLNLYHTLMSEIPYNPDQNEYLFRPSNDSLDLLEESVKTPEGVRRVATNLKSALILGARGIADQETVIDAIKRAAEHSLRPEDQKIAKVVLLKIQKDEGLELFANIRDEIKRAIAEGHEKSEEFVAKAADLFGTPPEQLVHNLHGRLTFLSSGELREINIQDECNGAVANTMKRDDLGKAAVLIHLKTSLDERGNLQFEASTPANSYEHELVHMFAQQDINNTVSSKYSQDGKIRTMQWRGFRPYLYHLDGRYDANLSYGYRREPNRAYDYLHLDEGATSLIRALIHTNGDLHGAQKMLEKHSYGTFEPISYTKWALVIARAIRGVDIHKFIHAYREGNIEGFNQLTASSGGKKSVLRSLALT